MFEWTTPRIVVLVFLSLRLPEIALTSFYWALRTINPESLAGRSVLVPFASCSGESGCMRQPSYLQFISILLVFIEFSSVVLLAPPASAQLSANAELGQPNFRSSICDNPALTPRQMLCHPAELGVNNGNDLLFVADGDNNRLLVVQR